MVKRRAFLLSAGGATASLSALSVEGLSNPVASEDTSCSFGNVLDPTYIDTRLDSRSISFENPTGIRGGGGKAGNGRKRHPFRILNPGEKIVLADVTGSGTVRHIWTMLSGLRPEVARALRLEVFYDGLSNPSISVPILDFFGLPHGRCAEYYSALVSVHEGRGLNSHIPMPFGRSIRVEFTNESAEHIGLFYQIDYTLESSPRRQPSYLHAAFRRENPTTLRRDFVIAEGLKGPGRFLGCSVGVRVIDKGPWYGEGEVKIYRDGDRDFPTYCGTGLEDYVGSAYGSGRHYGLYSGAPINIPDTASLVAPQPFANPTFVGFYRWHLPDPIMFSNELRVTIQQIGGAEEFKKGQEAAFAAYRKNHIAAGPGWYPGEKDSLGAALIERSDDYCATAFIYCQTPQPVSPYSTELAVRDIGLIPVEDKAKFAPPEDEAERKAVEGMKIWNE